MKSPCPPRSYALRSRRHAARRMCELWNLLPKEEALFASRRDGPLVSESDHGSGSGVVRMALDWRDRAGGESIQRAVRDGSSLSRFIPAEQQQSNINV